MMRVGRGLMAPVRGLRLLLANPNLWPMAVLPTLLTLVLISGALVGAFWAAGPVMRWLAPGLLRIPILFVVARSSMVLLLILTFGPLSYMLASLLSLPIHDALSQKVEALERPLPPPLSFREALPLSIRHSLAGFGIWLAIQIGLVFINVIPVVGAVLEFFFGFLFTAFFLAHQTMDGAMSRQKLSFSAKMAWLFDHFAEVMGLGAAATLMLAVPLVNVVGLTIAITGGTLLYVQLSEEREASRRSVGLDRGRS